MPDFPSGTVTFLFTDIEGSTALWERDRAAMRSAVERQLLILQSIATAHHGVLYKRIGDGTQLAFATAEDGVRAALDAQRALRAEAWADAPAPLRVRMAMHVGEALPQDGDYLAAPLNRLSRVLTIGHGGQILLTQAAQQLTRGALPPGVTLHDLGDHRMRDLLEPERVYQLLHPDLPADFPPLMSLNARPNNLPRQPTPFLGREAQVQEIVTLLRREDVQLLTLTGPGGTGKSRLALQGATDLLDVFTNGVSFVPLAPLTDPAHVPEAIAQALGLRNEGNLPLVERLQRDLETKELLLVIDNCEHLIASAPVVGSLLEAAPRLKVLATSRVPLRLRAEREYPVPPLGLPRRQPPPSPEQLSQYEAVRLFIARAQAVKPDFAVDNANAPAVAEICHRLDGLPLAIELAAARLRLLPPQAMLTRLEQRLPLLTSGARDAPARQQTLRQTIAWSYDLLQPEEQTVFRSLALFTGGFDLAAAEVVANVDGAVDVFAGMTALVDHNLVQQADGFGGEPRFTMLETIREFGLERLRASDEEDEARARHARWYREMIASLDLYHANAGDETWFGLVQSEEDNLRQALGWFATHDDAYALNDLSAALFKFWLAGSRFREGRHWLEQAIARDEGLPLLIRSRARGAVGMFAAHQGDYATAAPLLEESLALARASGDANRLAEALLESGSLAAWLDDPQQALVDNREAEQVARGMTSAVGPLLAAVALSNQAWALRSVGELDEALTRFDEAVALARAPGGAWSVSVALRGRGTLRLQLNDTEAATADLIEAIALIWQRRDWGSLTGPLRQLSVAAALTAQSVRALLLLGAADGIDRSIGQEAVEAVRERETIARCLHQVRELDASQQTELRLAGEALGPEQAVDLVREVARVILGNARVTAIWEAVGAPDPGPVPPSPDLALPSTEPAPGSASM